MKTNLLFIFLFTCCLTSCKKDAASARRTDYTFVALSSNSINGTVSFIEKTDISQTTVAIALNNTPDTRYVAHLHDGPLSGYHIALFGFEPIPAAGGKISYTKNIPITYDSAVRFNGTFVLHDSLGDIVLGSCGVGINK